MKSGRPNVNLLRTLSALGLTAVHGLGTEPPYKLHAKVSPVTGAQDDGEFLIIDMTKLAAATSTGTVTT